jgi:D-alanyl-D-alanine dipeptidase
MPKLLNFPRIASLSILMVLVACAQRQIVPAAPLGFTEAELNVIARARDHQLVPLTTALPGIYLDQRYRTTRNVTGVSFYPPDLPCLIHVETAAKLRRALKLLTARGYQLKVWDAYRPPESHLVLWHKFGASGYVHEPGNEDRWSWHCYGRAVDLTLVDRDGNDVLMPSDFDEFSPKAWAVYHGQDPEVEKRLRILEWAMTSAGFEILDSEWWHFSDPLPEGVAKPSPVFARDLGIVRG